MTTKKQILTDIQILTQQTDRVFSYPGLKAMRKAVLLEKLEIVELLLLEQGKFDKITTGYTDHELLAIAVFGASDDTEKKIVAISRTIGSLAENFEVSS